jgi:Tol biopolymer transport system component
MTQPGVVLGTAAYMSPEQAKGKAVDRRADIWALGCILYECLAGKRAFEGETVTETLAAILKGDPDWQVLPHTVPENIRFVLRRCLDKDTSRRFRDAADVRIEMEEARPTDRATIRVKHSWLAWGVAGISILALSAVLFIHFGEKTPTPSKPARLQIALPDNVNLAVNVAFAISPDGSCLAFEAEGADGITRIWIRKLDLLETRPLPGTETSQWPIFWSPDSSFIAFPSGGKLKKINVSGGPPQEICNLEGPVQGGAWNRDGVIILGQAGTGEVMRVSSAGGTLSRLTELNRERKELMHAHPTFLPDGRHFLYFCLSAAPNNQGIYLGDLDTSAKDQENKLILISNHQPVYVPALDSGRGNLLFQRQNTLMAQAFDEKRLELVGEPLPVAEKVDSAGVYGLFSASKNGVLVYRTGTNTNTQPTWFDRQGKILGTVGEPGFYFRVALSRNGERAAVGCRMPPGMLADVWLLDFLRGTNTRLTFGKGDSMRPVWSPDGNRVAFSGTREGGASGSLYQKLASGAKEEELLLKSGESKFVTNWSSDGRFLLYTALNQTTKNDLWVLPIESGAQAHSLLHSEFNEDDGQFSPDMHWIAYVSDESGRDEIYVREFSETSGMASREAVGEWQQVSQGGGKGPRWRGDGKELYYQTLDGTVMAVGITADTRFRAGLPKVLFKAPPSDTITLASSSASPVWDVTKDGNRFLLAIPTPESSSPPFTVILNWTALLKK